MKWIAISGGWRKTNKEIEKKVRQTVREFMTQGNGLVSGGALGVDFIALDEAMKHNPEADRIKIFIPSSFAFFKAHYRKRAREEVITQKQAEDLIAQLKKLKDLNNKALIETKGVKILNKETYYSRNTKVVEAADELIAFRIKSKDSQGLGTLDTIKKSKKKGIPVKIFSYSLT